LQWRVQYGRDRSGSVQLVDGVHITGYDPTFTLDGLTNALFAMPDDNRYQAARAFWVERSESIDTYGRLEDTQTYVNAVTRSSIGPIARTDLLKRSRLGPGTADDRGRYRWLLWLVRPGRHHHRPALAHQHDLQDAGHGSVVRGRHADDDDQRVRAMSRRRLRGINQIHNDFLTESFGAVDARAVQRNLDATVAFGNRRPVPIVSGRWDDGSAQRRLLEVLVDLGLIQDETEKGDLTETGGYGAVPGVTALLPPEQRPAISIVGNRHAGPDHVDTGRSGHCGRRDCHRHLCGGAKQRQLQRSPLIQLECRPFTADRDWSGQSEHDQLRYRYAHGPDLGQSIHPRLSRERMGILMFDDKRQCRLMGNSSPRRINAESAMHRRGSSIE
jgi:hypothetical protein